METKRTLLDYLTTRLTLSVTLIDAIYYLLQVFHLRCVLSLFPQDDGG